MKRMGMMLRIRAGRIDEYKKAHREVWPSVLAQIERSNIHNYSIFLREPENILFAYFEYHGTDYPADMRRMAADPETRRWWDWMEPLQEPLDTRADGEWWATMEEVFYLP
ncbi:L-rhamnose mutarotase [Lichenifustis flavocetrariae]|uniref:L-rhamnose mutarotase n=1 Tax=Lichenifustis flavocetrariae TaxID=2949735 RepID=A0AA41YX18_9HYPH|nr:L-rhamnose mutarotase [Lichenifustis flavocetrariae]MCW6508737.1 L-rhamnose mutarotase [Lichenifustis flavocetrariae]